MSETVRVEKIDEVFMKVHCDKGLAKDLHDFFSYTVPNAKFTIHHQIGRDDPMMPPRAAIRWSLQGKHDGWGVFGTPTGADLFVLGISHAEFGPWGLRREYTLFDETSVWKQILLQTGEL